MSNSDVMKQIEDKYRINSMPAPNYESLDSYKESMGVGKTITYDQRVAAALFSGKYGFQDNKYSGVLGNILSRATLTGTNFDQVYYAAKEQGAKQSELDSLLNDAIQSRIITKDAATQLREARFSSVEDTYMTAKRTGASAQDLDSYLKRAVSAGRISQEDATALREKREKKDTGLFSENGKWLKKGLDDAGTAIVASGLDAGNDFLAGIIGAPESIFRGAAALAPMQQEMEFYQNGGIYTLGQENANKKKAEQAKSAAAELITKDFYDEDSIAKSILTGLSISLYNDSITSSGRQMTAEDVALSHKFGEDYRKYLDEDMEDDSILGEQMDGLARSAGQQVFTKAIGGVIPWQLTTGLSTMGDEMAQALNEGATFEEAGVSGMVSAAGEVLSEYIFDADIFGHSSIEEKLVKQISSKVSNKVLQAALKFGMDATGEGLEEVISGVIGAIGQKLTYGSDKEIKELFSSEEALDSFIGGAIMGGVNSAANTVISKATGTDYVSGLNKSEQAVVDKVYKERLKEARKDSKNSKVSASEKTAIYNDVLNSLEKGYLSTDSIEAALGGKAYEDYQSVLKIQEDNDILQTYEKLGKNGSLKDLRKYEGMESTVQRIQDIRKALKDKMDAEVRKQVQGTKLQESYTERTRRGQTFEADLSQYEGKQKEIVQKAVESGVLNNTNRTHEFVDLISSIAAQSGVDYDFTNNATLKNSGFAVEGKQVNGYTTAGGVAVNIDSTKALNRVVGHEITHVLEGTELYGKMQSALEDYAMVKGEYDARQKYVNEQYKNMKDADIPSELTAELAGDYLFSDADFLNQLAQENPDVFQKAWNQIKRICKLTTDHTKEGKALDKAQRAYEEAFREAQKAKKNATNDGGVKYSITEIVDENNQSYGTGVRFDSTLLDNLTDAERVKMVKEYVTELGGTELTAHDSDGNTVTFSVAKPNESFVNEGGKKVRANKDLDSKFNKNKVKQETIAHIEEVALAANFTGSKESTHSHDWIDNNGKNQWDYWQTYVVDKNNTIWRVTLNVANAKDGRKIIYDVGGIKKVGGSVFKSDTFMSPTKNSIAPSGENIKYNISDNSPTTPKTKADVFGSDIMLAPVREDVKPVEITAPTREDIAKVERAMDDNFAPIREDIAQRQKLQAKQAELEEKLFAMTAAENFGEEYQALSRQWAEVKNQVEAIAPVDNGKKSLQEFAEQTKKKEPSLTEKVAKEHLDHTFTLEKAPDVIKEKFGPKWQKVREATSIAQNVIINGDKGVKPLAYIVNKVNQDGFGGEFELYMRHMLNTDRMTLEERGYPTGNKTVFNEDVTADVSRQMADKLLSDHPEFAEYEKDVRDYVHYLRDKLVDTGKISQETADLWEEMYPHYIPIRRIGFQDDTKVWDLLNSVLTEDPMSADLTDEGGNYSEQKFTDSIEDVATLHKATGGDQQIYPLMDTLAERTLTTFWGAALTEESRLPDDFAPIREDATVRNQTEQVSSNRTLADDYIERTVLENTLQALKATGEPYAEIEQQLDNLNRRIKSQEAANPDVQPFQKGQSPKQNTPEPAKRTFETEPSAESLDVDSPASEGGKDDGVNYDIRDVSPEVFREMNPLKWAREMLLDNGMVFENLSHKTGNKKLDAYWNYTRDAAGRAQYLIGNGSEGDGVTGIKTIYDTAKKAGKLESFEEYLGHCRNIDGMTRRTRYATMDNQSFMGEEVRLTDSKKAKIELENQNPEFEAWAQQCYDYTDFGISELEKHKIISHEDAQMWKEVWDHYIPIKRTADGNNAGILETMAQQTLHIQNSVAMNDFAVELMHTLNSKVSEDSIGLDTLVKTFDASSNMFQVTKDDRGWYYFNCYEDGKICKFQISEEMYLALKPANDLMNLRVPGLADFSEFRRKTITEYNIFFALKNSVKDAQTVMIQSQHPLETYANMPGAAWDILNNGELYQEYLANGGDEQQFFHKNNHSLDEGLTDKLKRYTGLEAISDLNNFIETVPRYAEYKVSRLKGESIQVAMLDSARVTTNFAAGGRLTKMVNRNGATFLNASVQGAVQLARNVREAQLNGLKGWLGLAARIGAVGLGGELLEMLWKDDEDYAALPDYITQNYYILWKNEDGIFYRIPKERTWAVIQESVKRVAAISNGDDTQDWKDFFQFCLDNLGPNNPFTNNVGSPIFQVLNNETWYHEDLVPRRLQDLPATEQYDEKTSDIAIWLAEALNEAANRDISDVTPDMSELQIDDNLFSLGSDLGSSALDKLSELGPKKLHYLLDQYSGVIGDELLPFSTPKAEGKSDSLLGKVVANPLRDIFTVDPVLNNRVTDQFFTTLEDLEAKAALPDATMEDKLKSSVAITCNVELSKLYKQRREMQTSDLADSEKYEQNRAITKKINRLMEDALDDLSDVHIDGNYAEVGDNRYHFSVDEETGEEKWWASKETKADGTDNWFYTQEYLSHENLGMDYADIWNGNYPTDYSGKNLYAEYKGKRYNFDTQEKRWYEITPKKADGEDDYYYQQEQTAAREFGISYEEFWNNREKYDDVLYSGHLWDDATQSYSKDYYTTIRCVLGVDQYAKYCDVLPTLKADKDANGNSISGSKKKKIKAYVNSLDIPDVQKHILFKVYYPKVDTYNYEILNYINNDNSLSYQDRVSILEELGAGVDEQGYVTWHPKK